MTMIGTLMTETIACVTIEYFMVNYMYQHLYETGTAFDPFMGDHSLDFTSMQPNLSRSVSAIHYQQSKIFVVLLNNIMISNTDVTRLEMKTI